VGTNGARRLRWLETAIDRHFALVWIRVDPRLEILIVPRFREIVGRMVLCRPPQIREKPWEWCQGGNDAQRGWLIHTNKCAQDHLYPDEEIAELIKQPKGEEGCHKKTEQYIQASPDELENAGLTKVVCCPANKELFKTDPTKWIPDFAR
jgi:hypothetical protein